VKRKAKRDDPAYEQSDRRAEEEAREPFKKGTPPDVTSTRAKGSRHGKVTADKWNQ
jgi:hypothetical protein